MSFSAQDKGNSWVERRKGLIQFIKKSRVFFVQEKYTDFDNKKIYQQNKKVKISTKHVKSSFIT